MESSAAFSPARIEELAARFESATAEDVIAWSLETFSPKISFASSFGAEDVAIIDMMCKADKQKTRVFTLETGRLNQETYDLIDDVRARYGIQVEVFFPDQKQVEEMVRMKGMNLMYESVENRKFCCNVRKVIPLNRALAGLDAWITGIRRDQVSTRAAARKVESDPVHNGIIKVNPLADWTSSMVWDYIKKNDIPYNKLHEKGYPSIGCEPCTRPVVPGEDERAGRWWWENAAHKECGLHFDPTSKKALKKPSSSES
ncbi:MAG: phosphoadenylyl-sulfate reductase [Nitrososphaera sp.]|jgi:phosphoadenosine phosphosulfate reductase